MTGGRPKGSAGEEGAPGAEFGPWRQWRGFYGVGVIEPDFTDVRPRLSVTVSTIA
jgi:hypothetical protein